jgi:hypothetical protein
MLEEKNHTPGAQVGIITFQHAPTERDQDPALVKDWRAPEDAHRAGNRAWLPCTEAFYWEMLEVLPPIYGPGCFAVSEAWKHDANGEPVYLWLRERPQFACRCATPSEIRAERGLK